MVTKLRKELNFLDVFTLASGAMISSGLFILPSLAYAKCGPSVFLAYILAGLFILPALLSQAELATAMPKAGGTYFFIDRSLGPPMGTLGGIANWFSLSFKSAFALVGLGIFFEILFPGITYFQVRLIAVGFLLIFLFLNILGAKEAGRIQVIIVLTLIGILIFYILTGVRKIIPHNYFPFLPPTLKTLFSTAGFVFISYGGLTKIASVAEEVKNPGKTLPQAMLSAWFVVSLLYTGAVFVTVGILPPEIMKTSHTPLSAGGKLTLSTPGLILLSLGGILAFISTANAGILSASRSPMAMARDNLFPPFFSRLNSRWRTPHHSILFTGLFMLISILFLDLEHLVEVASALQILLFTLLNVSVIVMRESKILNYRPKFKAPFYPWCQIAGIIGSFFLLWEFGFLPLLITICFLLASFAWYAIYARPRVSRESGLIYLVQRLLSRHLSKGILRRELREIIKERDEIVEDRFDRIIKNAPILDFKESLSLDEFFRKASEILSKRLNLDQKEIYRLLWERERESSTVIAPGLAIPHVVIPGEKKFEILLARAKEGIIFQEETPPIHTIFLLIGTRDERNFHLKALAAIAQIAQDKEFEEHWEKARNIDELRDAVLLAERRRE